MDEADVADHAFLDGRLLLREPRRGHRSGTDAILLAAASRVGAGQHVMDVGAGAGAAALAILCRVDDATATLVESDPAMAALARHNIAANGFSDRAAVLQVDLFDPEPWRETVLHAPDVIVSNPPFHLNGTVRNSPNPQRARSHVLPTGGHGDWLRGLLKLATPKRRVVAIHRPDAVPDLLKAAEGRAAVRLRSVHPRATDPANRVLLDLEAGKRTPFTIEPPLILHNEDGGFTTFAEDLHRGRAWW